MAKKASNSLNHLWGLAGNLPFQIKQNLTGTDVPSSAFSKIEALQKLLLIPGVAERMRQYLMQHRVIEGECWKWTRHRDKTGYGLFQIGGVHFRVHRTILLLEGVSISETCGDVRHSCHNPPCFNPAHLAAGRNLDNVQDRKDRWYRCENESWEETCYSKLRMPDVLLILQKTGWGTGRQHAARFGVTTANIRALRQGKTWKPVVLRYLDEHPRIARNFHTSSAGYRDTKYYDKRYLLSRKKYHNNSAQSS